MLGDHIQCISEEISFIGFCLTFSAIIGWIISLPLSPYSFPCSVPCSVPSIVICTFPCPFPSLVQFLSLSLPLSLLLSLSLSLPLSLSLSLTLSLPCPLPLPSPVPSLDLCPVPSLVLSHARMNLVGLVEPWPLHSGSSSCNPVLLKIKLKLVPHFPTMNRSEMGSYDILDTYYNYS